jgi:serine/threonine-protein kinase
VKPANILGTGLEFKLADFGLAIDSPASPTAKQRSGTLNFMAPEAMRGEALDRRTDVFSLGATAFSLRYGYSPFPSVSATLGPAPARFPRAVSTEEAAFQDLLSRMLAKSPRDRPSDLANPRRLFGSLASVSRSPAACTRRADGSYALHETIFTCMQGDIAMQHADGIVNSANHELRMRDGVAGALRALGGDEIEQEAIADGERPLGACVVTGAGRLRASHVLHAVCAWQAASCIGRAMQSTLVAAEKLGLFSLAIPALGTGAAAVSLEASAGAIAAAVRAHVLLGGSRLQRLSFVLYDAEKLRVFRDVLESVLLADATGPIDVGLLAASALSDDKTAAATKGGA